MDLVVDCSICLPWVFDDENGEDAQRVLDLLASGTAVVPPLWNLEIVNGLLMATRKGRITPDEALKAVSLFDDLPIEIDDGVVSRRSLLILATQYSLTAYDAVYLELALRTQLPLATQDRQLAEAAQQAGCDVVGAT